MALWIKDAYGTVFDVKANDKFVHANISTSRKSKAKDSDKDIYINSSWSASFLGKAKDAAKNLENKDRIKINMGYVSHEKAKVDDEGKGVYYYNLVILDFEKVDSKGSSNDANPKPKAEQTPVDDGDYLPF